MANWKRRKSNRSSRPKVISPEVISLGTRVMSPEILSHVACNFIECINMKLNKDSNIAVHFSVVRCSLL